MKIKPITWEILDISGQDSDGNVLASGDDNDVNYYRSLGIDLTKEKGFHAKQVNFYAGIVVDGYGNVQGNYVVERESFIDAEADALGMLDQYDGIVKGAEPVVRIYYKDGSYDDRSLG